MASENGWLLFSVGSIIERREWQNKASKFFSILWHFPDESGPLDIIEDKIDSAIKRSVFVLSLNNNPFDEGKAVEALCNIAKITLEADFNPMEVDVCNYLQKLLKVFSKHKNIDLKNATSDIKTLIDDRCNWYRFWVFLA